MTHWRAEYNGREYLKRPLFGRLMQWLDSDAGWRWVWCPVLGVVILACAAAILGPGLVAR